MFNITLKRWVATLTVTGGLLAAVGPPSAILYNGHAGLGASVYQHNQTDLEFAKTSGVTTGIIDGTSNTLQTGLLANG
jgi:hypothetical protein